MQMDKDKELLDTVTIFLIILVSVILIFSQYQFFNIMQGGYLFYLSGALIVALVVLVILLFNDKKPQQQHSLHEHQHSTKIEKELSKPLTFVEKLSYILVAIVVVVILFNQVQISQVSALAGIDSGGLTSKLISGGSSQQRISLSGDPTKDALSLIPKGKRFYSDGLGVSFDDPIRSLEVIAQLDPSYGRNRIQLTPAEKERYIRIFTTPTITCEFCCGVKTAVTKDGRPTCGCKHSWGLRGLGAYLIKNYPQLSDDQIIQSLAEWKVMFFPKQMLQRYVQESQTGQYTPDIKALLLDSNLENTKGVKTPVASNNNQQSGSDVAATLNNLPNQVGGC